METKPTVVLYGLGDSTLAYTGLLGVLDIPFKVARNATEVRNIASTNDFFILATPEGVDAHSDKAGPYLCGLLKEMYGDRKKILGVGEGDWERMLADAVISEGEKIDFDLVARLKKELGL